MATAGQVVPPHPPQGGPDAQTEVFAYTAEDFVRRGVEWKSGSPGGPIGSGPSEFDRALQQGWKDRLERGLFRYPLGHLQTRILPGKVGFVAQLNVRRGSDRRPPQEIQSIRQAFNPQQFNFTHIRAEEVLFALARRGLAPGSCPPPALLVVINVSPLEFGHVLLIPAPALSLPQILTPKALHFGLEALLLSAHPGFRIGFNSLGAFASVNHLHLHGFYLNWELLVESAPCRPLLPDASLHLLQGVPAPGLLFYSEGQDLEPLARTICRFTSYLVEKEIAHNLFATRGAAPEGLAGSGARPGIRVILWPRRPCFGAKEQSAFNVALCELAGHLPVKTARDFESLTEASAIQTIQKYLLPEPEFARLQCELVALLKE